MKSFENLKKSFTFKTKNFRIILKGEAHLGEVFQCQILVLFEKVLKEKINLF